MNDFTASNGIEVNARADNVGGGFWFGPGADLGVLNGVTGGQAQALREFFDAHPEPRPWHDAKPGDVWRFETSDDRRHALGWVAQDGTWDLMTPRGENVREVVEPVAWLVENWGDEFEGAKATRFVPEVSS